MFIAGTKPGRSKVEHSKAYRHHPNVFSPTTITFDQIHLTRFARKQRSVIKLMCKMPSCAIETGTTMLQSEVPKHPTVPTPT